VYSRDTGRGNSREGGGGGARACQRVGCATRGARCAGRAWIARFSAADVEAVGPPCDFTCPISTG